MAFQVFHVQNHKRVGEPIYSSELFTESTKFGYNYCKQSKNDVQVYCTLIGTPRIDYLSSMMIHIKES